MDNGRGFRVSREVVFLFCYKRLTFDDDDDDDDDDGVLIFDPRF